MRTAIVTLLMAASLAVVAAAASDPIPVWGPYRPHLYFGTRPRVPGEHTAFTGLMWASLRDHDQQPLAIRHECRDPQLPMGLDAATRDYARQHVADADANLNLTTEYVREAEHQWAVRITGSPLDPRQKMAVGVFYYVALGGYQSGADNSATTVFPPDDDDKTLVHAKMDGPVGEFSTFVFSNASSENVPNDGWLAARLAAANLPVDSLWRAKDALGQILTTVAKTFIEQTGAKNINDLPPPYDLFTLQKPAPRDGNLHLVQRVFTGPFTLDVVFVKHDSVKGGKKPVSVATDISKGFSVRAARHHAEFLSQFAATFPSLLPEHQSLAHFALANLLGGTGYWYGDDRVDPSKDDEADFFYHTSLAIDDEDEAAEQWLLQRAERRKGAVQPRLPARELFALSPSRSQFPRGFLWDEGFMQVLVARWDPALTRAVLRSWYATQDADGWIPREQILGDEARAAVPPEFVAQSPIIANPPTLFMAVEALVTHGATQHGQFAAPEAGEQAPLVSSHEADDFLRELYPKLAKHLRWFLATQRGEPLPRKLVQDDRQRRQVFRWRGRTPNHNFASGLDDYPRADPPHTGELHVDLTAWIGWAAGVLAQLGARIDAADVQEWTQLHADVVENLVAAFWHDNTFTDLRDDGDGEMVPVVRRGYVSLVPYALRLLHPQRHADHVQHVTALVRELLHPRSGIRSLHPADPVYGTGEDYWRGAVWLNFQYLVLGALQHYSAHDVYADARGAVLDAMLRSFEDTRDVWESYDAESGRGRGAHPFTGWSALVVLIMAEHY